MKKVLLTSAAVLALFAAAAPAVADINGGANTPGAYDQPTTGGGVNDAYNAQTEFETLITKLKQLVVTSSQTTKVVLLKLLKMVLTTLTQIQLNKNLKMLVNTSNQNVMLTETSSKMSL